jgi:large subunit ribosomal protein L19
MSVATLPAFSSVNIAQRKKLDIRPGDTVRIWEQITEGDKTRTQAFEGLVIARRHGTEPGATFTVRRTASGVGVERTYFLYSPLVQKIELVRRSKVRRAKLYYIRDRAARDVQRKMRSMRIVGETLADESMIPDQETDGNQTDTEEKSATQTQEDNTALSAKNTATEQKEK